MGVCDMPIRLGILTAGNDAPGLNAAIRAIGKTAQSAYGMSITGFQDGFKGLVENKAIQIKGPELSGILTLGGTILGTSQELPHQMMNGYQKPENKIDSAVDTYKKHKLDALVCLGGIEMQVGALKLYEAGLNIITLPKAIDNNVQGTDFTVGFDTALSVSAEAIDRLHSTAHSHHRIILVEIMGKKAGWLTLGAGIAGGADVILIPEIPYNIKNVAEAIKQRNDAGKRFSIVAVSEGAITEESLEFFKRNRRMNAQLRSGTKMEEINTSLDKIENQYADNTNLLSHLLKNYTGLDTRTTILGFLLRGGVPSANDRMRATQLGSSAATAVKDGLFGVMLGFRDGEIKPAPLAEIAGKQNPVPLNHNWIESARQVGTCFGD
jgi:6-phosphofructokinase 1